MSEIKQIEPNDWKAFLEEFSTRNNNRRARFQVFKGRETEEESQESHLEEVSIKSEGNSQTVVVTRIDRTKADATKIRDTITNVRGIAVQYDTDGSEDVLEISERMRGIFEPPDLIARIGSFKFAALRIAKADEISVPRWITPSGIPIAHGHSGFQAGVPQPLAALLAEADQALAQNKLQTMAAFHRQD